MVFKVVEYVYNSECDDSQNPGERRRRFMDNNFLSLDDLSDVLAELNSMEEVEEEVTEEEKASQRRYEEIIRKHKDDNN